MNPDASAAFIVPSAPLVYAHPDHVGKCPYHKQPLREKGTAQGFIVSACIVKGCNIESSRPITTAKP